MLLQPGFELTLRPMRYPAFYEMYRNAVRNTWTVEEVDFSLDVNDLHHKFGPAERHLIERLVAFFATGDSIVANGYTIRVEAVRENRIEAVRISSAGGDSVRTPA